MMRMTRIALGVALSLCALLCAACGKKDGELGGACFPNYTCSVGEDGHPLLCVNGHCAVPACVQGTKDCGCLPDATCSDGLTCTLVDNVQVCKAGCNIGDLGCGCGAGHTCNASPDGSALLCINARCVAAECNPGELNCACQQNYGCASGLVCNGDFQCVARASCPAGTAGCPCLDTGNCSAPDLLCGANSLCQPTVCAQGDEGCGCHSDYTCNASATGGALVCITGKCVKRSCTTAGLVDCPCTAAGTCLPGGTCRNGVCLGSDALTPPTTPQCYTPCESGLTVSSGTFVQCGSDHLLSPQSGFDGCLDGRQCVQGSCIFDGGMVPTCTLDTECPDFQACIQGHCYSTCSLDSECVGGHHCYRHVCRAACTAANDTCPTGTTCTMTDSTNGVCMPSHAPTPGVAAQVQVIGSFELSDDSVVFSNARTSANITLTNHSPTTQEFLVRKLDQVASFTDGGIILADAGALSWITLGASTVPLTGNDFRVLVDALPPPLPDGGIADGGSTVLRIANANGGSGRWQGRIEVSNAQLGSRTVALSYESVPQGRWSGKMHYFGSFDDPMAPNLSTSVNAFVQRWSDFKAGSMSRQDFDAMLTSTLNGSWQWASTKQACRQAYFPALPLNTKYCYLTTSVPSGVKLYTDESTRAPTGVTELPLAFDIQPTAGQPAHYTGKIATSESLQYPDNPALDLVFASDPASCGSLCSVQSMTAAIVLGGRFLALPADDCTQGGQLTFSAVATPWLLPDFREGAYTDGGVEWFTQECRSTTVKGVAANPIPDGRSRKRKLELVDGLLLDQSRLLLLVREKFEDNFFPAAGGSDPGFAAYGVMILDRAPTTLQPSDYVGNVQMDSSIQPADILTPSCAAIASKLPASATTLAAKVDALISPTAATGAQLYGAEEVHYLCEDTGLLDSGPAVVNGATQLPRQCPVGGHVTFFASTLTDANIAALPCQLDGTCKAVIAEWEANQRYGFARNPVWQCTATNVVLCDNDRYNLRSGKTFYRPTPGAPTMLGFFAAMDLAFRYKTRFMSRQGTGLAFTPSMCSTSGTSQTPYCYDPKLIEELRARVDCLKAIAMDPGAASMPSATQVKLQLTLRGAFGRFDTVNNQGIADNLQGFESFDTELLVMLGDEAYTKAFASRFDLASSNSRAFRGDLFEQNGFNLAGGAGNEMYQLYLATQYYQLSLNRFFGHTPYIQAAAAPSYADPYALTEAGEEYFKKLVRASTQKSRAWSEIAKRYQGFNRPDLARAVVERAYTATYLEALVLVRMLRLGGASPEQIQVATTDAARSYRAAMLDMRDVYQSLTDDATFFGYTPDFVPFPTLNPGDVNAFEKAFHAAQASASIAQTAEVGALGSSRSYDTDMAQFQSELVKISTNYDNQLGDLCGTFRDASGAVRPATSKYAALDPNLKVLADPCGMVGNGQLFDAIGQLQIAKTDVQAAAQQYDDVFAEINIERDRVNAQCNLSLQLADYQYAVGSQVNNLQDAIRGAQNKKAAIERAAQSVTAITQTVACGLFDCPSRLAASVVISAARVVADISATAIDQEISQKEGTIDEIRNASARWQTGQHQCDVLAADLNASTQRQWLRLAQIDLEATKAQYRLQLALSDVYRLRNQAVRTLDEQEESEQQLINVTAAQNNPNVRIYKNDAIISADRTFEQAVRDAYRATKVFEYYTSQSYAHLEDLFLVRMVNAGTYDVNSYLQGLQNAYVDFQQQYGNPDTRVQVFSLRDDIMAVSRIDTSGAPRTQADRVAEFRRRLSSSELLDDNGYLTLPFATSLIELSPLTRDHKLLQIEAEVVGSDVGDAVGRVYLRQRGTSAVAALGPSATNFYRLPERTAVINAFFNGVRVFTPDVYKTDRLRDRPYVNTRWELVLNQRDEAANKDINLHSLTDIRLYLYYSDFTQ